MASSEDAIGRCNLKNKKEDRRSRKQDINSRQRRISIFLGHCKTTTQQPEITLRFDKIAHKKLGERRGNVSHWNVVFKKNKQKTPNKRVLFCRDKNCTAIWEAFKVVLDKDPCSVRPSDYDLFINLSRHSIPRDKSLFWENNHLLVTSYAESGRRVVPLCNVLYGRLGDFLNWCRQTNASGLDYQSCPTSEDCENNPVDSFWRSASIQYARDSSGVISVMLNGSEPAGAYPVKGFFADFEIPYLQKDKITRIEIWVMHDIRGPKVESCGEGSVKLLEERLGKLGFQYSCIDDYLPVKLLQCLEHSTHPDCALSSAAASTQREAFYAEQSAYFIFPLLAAFTSVAQM
nr:ADP-ribosyl cyclase/cyclic ADP-ribose hydrolase 2 [Odocoileus virginianus texanus]